MTILNPQNTEALRARAKALRMNGLLEHWSEVEGADWIAPLLKWEEGERANKHDSICHDGYPRHAAAGTPVAVDGVMTRLIGRVSMDMLTVDLTPCPSAHVGSSVELWGSQVRIDDVAHAAVTIGYELMCGLARRVPVETVSQKCATLNVR